MANKKDKKVTIIIPAYKAQKYICDMMASIYTQTIRDNIQVIISSDWPEDDYSFVKERFPELDIKILKCKKNTGPGLARQRGIDAAKTKWITFADADDLYAGPVVIENMILRAEEHDDCVELIAPFYEEANYLDDNGNRFIKKEGVWHPWVFARLYRLDFIKNNGIEFSDLRCGEDCEFNWKLQHLAEGTDDKVYYIRDAVYIWKKGSENSLVRANTEECKNDAMPQFNFDMSAYGLSEAAIRTSNFLKEKKKGYTKNYILMIMAVMNTLYLTYLKCLYLRPIFVEQSIWIAKKYYNILYKEIDGEGKVSPDKLYKMCKENNSKDFEALKKGLGNRFISLPDFLNMIRPLKYEGIKEFWEIRSRLPEDVRLVDEKSHIIDCVPKE